MAFIDKNFTPAGSNARAGNAPQVFNYISQDTLAVIRASGYFNELKGYLRRGDWLDIASDIDGTIGQALLFITGDGQSPGILSVQITDDGAGYDVGDLIFPTFTDGDVIQKVVLEVLTETSNAITSVAIVDPGLFNTEDMPTDFTDLATTSNATGTGAKFTLFPTASNAGILTALLDGANAGSGYAVNDLISPTLTGPAGSIISQPIIKVATLSGSGFATGTIEDPGRFDVLNLPTGLINLATVTLTGTGSGAQLDTTGFDVVLGQTPAKPGLLTDITVSTLDIIAAA